MTRQDFLGIVRADETRFILDRVNNAGCCAIVGLSNMGKSALLRSIKRSVQTRSAADLEMLFIYIDFNLMVEMTEQAFYEIILRSVRAALDFPGADQVQQRVQDAYRQVVDSSNPFLVPLGFNEGIIALCETLGRRVVLLCDEFDESFNRIDQRVFLNLRALKDRYAGQLVYVVATGKRLEDMRQGSEIGEFAELFAHQVLYLGPLNRDDMAVVMQVFLDELMPTANDVAFVWRQTGGHPGLLEAVCHLLSEGGVGIAEDDYGLMCDKLDSDLTVRAECAKLWNALDETQQQSLLDFVSDVGVDRRQLRPLIRRGVLRQTDREIEVFGELFGGFVRRQRLVKTPYVPGVRVDVDSGEVWVDGQAVATLTDLEFKLLLLLYGRIGKLCDKYQIVESVWGEEYIDQVDDARIEKLVSRLRKKLEPDTVEPCYLQTVRGRGYRLVEA
ncbi:MAG: winged helix-turn-helix domain-containing protein [Anaerolineae bacterium]|nr:winged helix-turn-helix domain-containing protein [Anaerolineae bacterium]